MRVRIRVNWEIPKSLLVSFLFALDSQIADLISSMGFGPGFHEMNAFARHLDGSFYLLHGVGNKAIYLMIFSVMATGIYLSLRPWDEEKAAAIATAPLLYYSILALLAVANNLMLHTGWFVPFLLGGN